MIGVSAEGDLGVDIEQMRATPRHLAVAQRFFAAEDYAFLDVHEREYAAKTAERLMGAMVDGLAEAAREQLPASTGRVASWHARRMSSARQARLTAGHIDVFALPPALPR